MSSLIETNKLNKKRQFANFRFKVYGIFGLSLACGALIYLLINIFSAGSDAFRQTTVSLNIDLDPIALEATSTSNIRALQNSNTLKVTKKAMLNSLPLVKKRKDQRNLYKLLSPTAEWSVRDLIMQDPKLIGSNVTLRLPLSSNVDQWYKAKLKGEAYEGRLNNQQITWLNELLQKKLMTIQFNSDFFTHADSRYPEIAGIAGAVVGSFYSLLICLLISFPLGVAAAIYLEEFAKKTTFTQFIEANINNLAAVPSVIFGLLGLAVILNMFGVPRSTALAGGIVLALMTLPTIIIACRSALKSVPPSIREAGLAMGASKVQVVMHHVMPAALSGTLTGTIIGLAQALGETAPLLMIGMIAFIANIPEVPTDAAASLPVQIYLWAESAERGFVEKTAAAIMVIIIFLILMNLVAIIVRQKTRQT
ncbi:MAG: phosphate ABC transporter permease PstA [Gammaproteobacteria bacterium]|nr:phosphate ABC transporter permease PstA [Gammaproteobacteria bacterium]